MQVIGARGLALKGGGGGRMQALSGGKLWEAAGCGGGVCGGWRKQGLEEIYMMCVM